MPDPAKYEGPFESQEEEDIAYKRSKHIKARLKKEDEEAEVLAEEERKKTKKKSNLLPMVD